MPDPKTNQPNVAKLMEEATKPSDINLNDLRKKLEEPNDPTLISTAALRDAFADGIAALININDSVKPTEHVKILGKLKGALELFNQK